ncbi:MAG: ribosomal protein S18-alanine N-acetyltransferase [Candidatus Omnitrophica bacterium]|nr:N-alpha-acetyltransferase RimI [bacterium]NUN94644.1 ribosomal protein S18-alanine N-acetyltransferase [Candidatus Omnitrophota bacterium]
MIAPLEESHIDQVCAIEKVSFPLPWPREAFLGELSLPYGKSWCWLEGDRVLGYLIAWKSFEDFHIINLAVSPEARGRGIARNLLRHALEWARGARAERSLLEVRSSNAAARALYLSAGFEVVGIRKNYYELPTEDGLILEKRLEEK